MIILDEKNFAEECLKHGLPEQNPIRALSIIARYYYHCKGLRGKKIIEALDEYLGKNVFDYLRVRDRWIETIEDLARSAGKYPLHETDGIWITTSELSTIETLHDKVLERLAFTVLCIAKLNNRRNPNNDNWVRISDKEVFKTARISDSEKNRRCRIGMLCDKGLLRLPNVLSSAYRVEFVDNKSDNSLFVSDFRELGYEYRKYKGERYVRCAECGVLIKGNKNGTRKYCIDCVAPSPQVVKVGTCVDCGNPFWISSKNNSSARCPHCQLEHKRDLVRIRVQKFRDKEAM